MYDLLDDYDEIKNLDEIRNINDFANKLFGIFSNIEEIQKGGKSFVLLDLNKKTEIIKMTCWFDQNREAVIFRAKLWKLPKCSAIKYYYNLMIEIIILTFIKFVDYDISRIYGDENYYYFEGEVKPIITESLGIFH
ncbi:MAG: hypothetical protein ACO2O4_00535 [Minisyncoccia bacterium]|jgi:hypothetical protein